MEFGSISHANGETWNFQSSTEVGENRKFLAVTLEIDFQDLWTEKPLGGSVGRLIGSWQTKIFPIRMTNVTYFTLTRISLS